MWWIKASSEHVNRAYDLLHFLLLDSPFEVTYYNTVGTPNKGQLIFEKNESNEGNFVITLFAIITK